MSPKQLGQMLVLMGAMLGAIGASVVFEEWSLQSASDRTIAIVTELREATGRSSMPTVRYEFQLEATRYTPTDFLFRKNLRVSIEQTAWNSLQLGGPIEVEYSRANPGISRPVGASSRTWDVATTLVLSVVLTPLGLLLWTKGSSAGVRIDA